MPYKVEIKQSPECFCDASVFAQGLVFTYCGKDVIRCLYELVVVHIVQHGPSACGIKR